jgi:hypothetical protein
LPQRKGTRIFFGFQSNSRILTSHGPPKKTTATGDTIPAWQMLNF